MSFSYLSPELREKYVSRQKEWRKKNRVWNLLLGLALLTTLCLLLLFRPSPIVCVVWAAAVLVVTAVQRNRMMGYIESHVFPAEADKNE